jgi:PTS system nitrogen regulatory IIA component
MQFGYVLKTLRLSAGIGLRELSRTIDVSPTYVSLVENGKQPPPNASRITQIEEALNVPPGYLQSIGHGITADLSLFLQQTPEVADFLHIAKKNSMGSADFMDLTGFLSLYGWKGLKEALGETGDQSVTPISTFMNNIVINPYVWSFLDEKLILDVSGVKGKKSFLAEVADRMADQLDGLQSDLILTELLKRENVASTGIGNGIALPHACLPNFNRIVVALARIREGLDFDAIDGKPVYLAMFLLGPCSFENVHLQLLARTAKLLGNSIFYRSVLGASDPGEIISLFKATEMRIPFGDIAEKRDLSESELKNPTKE